MGKKLYRCRDKIIYLTQMLRKRIQKVVLDSKVFNFIQNCCQKIKNDLFLVAN